MRGRSCCSRSKPRSLMVLIRRGSTIRMATRSASTASARIRPRKSNVQVCERAWDSPLPSDGDFKSVIGRSDNQLCARAADLIVAAGFAQDPLDHAVVVDRLVMEHHQMLDAG